MEGLVREMKDEESGVRVKSQKLFLTSIPSAFAGTYYIQNYIIYYDNIQTVKKNIYIYILKIFPESK